MNSNEKKDLLAIDDFVEDLPDIIDWAIRYKNDTEIHDDFKPLDGLSIGRSTRSLRPELESHSKSVCINWEVNR